MYVKVFINPNSGGVRNFGAERLSSTIFHRLKGAGHECEIETCGAPEIAAGRNVAANDDRIKMVIVAGGDGTLAAAAQQLVGSQIPLLLLPGGTMNFLAHDLGIGGDMEAAIDVALDGEPKLIDVGFVNGRAFLNNIVFGDYAALTQAREQIREARGLEDRLGAISDATQAILSAGSNRYSLRFDDNDLAVESNVIMAANNRYTGAFEMRPHRERIDTGKLAFYIADKGDGIDLIARMIEVVSGEVEDAEAVRIIETTHCRVTQHGESGAVSVAIDGDPVEMDGPFDVTIAPHALTVFCPNPGQTGDH
jgi:diacylglycerol kinase family enzyme